jgi:hypothetical protein
MKRILGILAALVLGVALVGCSSKAVTRPVGALPTAEVIVVPAEPTAAPADDTCALPDDVMVALASPGASAWLDYGYNNGRGRGDGIGVVVEHDDGRTLLIPACARADALRLLESH